MRSALLRHVFRGHVMTAAPVTVVEDTDERTVLYLREGTRMQWIDGPPMTSWVQTGHGTVRWEWHTTNALLLCPIGRAHATQAMFKASSGRFLGWYVNLQEALRPTPLGWDTCDQELDILVWPDLSRWEWKDEDEFEHRVEMGLLTRAEADAIRREGEAVIADVEAGRPPFSEPWPQWSPDPSWPVPTLPDGWDVL